MTPKQFQFLRDLLVRSGRAHPTCGLRSSGRAFCGAPQSASSWDGFRRWCDRRTASQLIDRLLAERHSAAC